MITFVFVFSLYLCISAFLYVNVTHTFAITCGGQKASCRHRRLSPCTMGLDVQTWWEVMARAHSMQYRLRPQQRVYRSTGRCLLGGSDWSSLFTLQPSGKAR